MDIRRIRCPECSTPVRDTEINQHRLSQCSGCDSSLEVEVFPAYFRAASRPETAEALLVDGDSTCFYHAGKKAVLPCQSCGRFVCALCDCELRGEHFCPVCLEAGKTKGRISTLETQRTRYDNMALALAVFPMILFYFTFVTAPIALFVAIRHWNAPPSRIERTRFRNLLAIGIAALQIVGWGLLILVLIGTFYGQ